MSSLIALYILLLPPLQLNAYCPITSSSAREGTKPLYLLTLAPFDRNVGILSGARIARDEVNNRTDLLPGYHLELITERRESCSTTGATFGLSNLLRYAVDPPCRPLVAVGGIGCSTHTEFMSPIAGHEGFDLIQLSSANSPIFQTQSHRFPHLWSLLGSATVYSDAAFSTMEQFNWTRVGIVHNSDSVYASENALYLERKIRTSQNKRMLFNIGVLGTNAIYFDQIITNIISEGATILIVMLDSLQDAILLSHVLEKGLLYPQYTWIHVETTPQWLINEEFLDQTAVYNGIHGHTFLFPLSRPQNKSLLLVSGESYLNLKQKFVEDLDHEELKDIFNRTNRTLHVEFGSYLYDQVWSLALALNISIPILNDRNLSIDSYTIGQPNITGIFEDQMANLSFQGAGGWVKFNQYRSVSTPVEVIWIPDKNGTLRSVGIFNSSNTTTFRVNLNTSSLPKDRLEPEYSLIPLPIAVVLYILTGIVTISTTIQLVLFLGLHFRGDKGIKATSPYLSLLMFAGCYLLLLACVAMVTNTRFLPVIISIHNELYIVLWCADILSTLNGMNLILVTLCIKLLRVYRIFSSKFELDLGKFWSSFSLFAVILGLTILPNVVVLPLLAFRPFQYQTYTVNVRRDNRIVPQVHLEFKAISYIVIGGFITFYFTVFSLFTLLLAIRTRNIKYENFKDTKKITLFIALLLCTLAFIQPLYIMLYIQGNEPMANIVLTIGRLIVVAASQIILLLPKILPTLLSVVCHRLSRKPRIVSDSCNTVFILQRHPSNILL